MLLDDSKQNIEEGTKVWATILQEVQQTETKKLPANKSILVLGDNDTGKTTLVAKLAGLENPKKGSGLEYNFIEIRDEYREDSTRLGAWILDGDLRHVNLLKFALTEENFENSTCLLVASMSQPWNIIESLETWSQVLENHIASLNIKPNKLKQLQQKLLLRFLNYVPTADEADTKLVSSINKMNQSMNTTQTNSSGDNLTMPEEVGDNTLAKNIGLDIIVVITKTDQIVTLEKDYDYTEETFDFIQQAIRKFCLRYGASLFYVSSRINKNCDLLHKYLAYRIYDLPFKAAPSVVEKDAIFVPAGWDNEAKISILYDNIRSVNPDEPYNNFITERVNPSLSQRELEVEVESDQEFLMRIHSESGKQVQAPSLPNAPSPVQQRQHLINPIESQPSGEGVLQNFFNSLLSKGRTMPPNSSGGGTQSDQSFI